MTFLGTGTSQGVPVIACECEVCRSIDFRDNRTRTSVHVQLNDPEFSIVIDTGPDFRQQILRERIKKLNAVIYTHQHKDHTAGLDEVRSFNFTQKQDMPIYGSKDVIDQLKRDYEYIFTDHQYPGTPRVQTNVIDQQPFELGGHKIIPIDLLHYRLPVFGFRIYDFTYITDANYISDVEMRKLKGTQVLVINALQKESHISHFTLDDALEVIEAVQPEKAFLTHISHKLGLHSEVEKELPKGVQLGYDGLEITL